MRHAFVVLLVVLLTACLPPPPVARRLRTVDGVILQAPTDVARPETTFFVVTWWQEECPYCIEQMEQMADFYVFASGHKFVELYGVYVGAKEEVAHEFNRNADFITLVGPTPRVATGLPFTQIYILNGEDWKPADTWIGVVTSEDLRRVLRDYCENMTGSLASLQEGE